MNSAAKAPTIHIHGVSVGEVLSAVPVVQGLLAAWPDCRILATSWTESSQKLLKSLYGATPRVTIDRLPVDLPTNHHSFYNKHAVNAALWIDSEIWPGWLWAMKKRGIPSALINGRMSERSFKRWSMFKMVIAKILGWFDRIDAQSALDAQRFRELGGTQTSVQPVNMKYMRPALSVDNAALSALRQALGGPRLAIAFLSTHPGDEIMAFDLHKKLRHAYPDLLTVIVPRHTDRVPELMTSARASGLTPARRSDPATQSPNCDVFFGDTIGEMALYLSLAPIAVIGKSFDPQHQGGQSPIEAGQLGRALVCGPYMTNFPGIMDDFKAADALIETDREGLSETLARLLADPALAGAYGRKAHDLCAAKLEAGPEYLAELVAYLKRVAA